MFKVLSQMISPLNSKVTPSLAGVVVGVSLLAIATPAKASNITTFGFGNIFPIESGSESSGDPFFGDFQMDVIENDASSVIFKFKNLDLQNTGHFIGSVFFDDNAGILNLGSVNLDYMNVGTVDFKTGNTNLPQGNKIGFVGDYGATKNGAASKGVHQSEALGIKISLAAGKTYANLISGITSGTVKSGIHVQSLPNGQSDSFVVNPGGGGEPPRQEVPEPNATVMLSLAALGIVETARRQRRPQ